MKKEDRSGWEEYAICVSVIKQRKEEKVQRGCDVSRAPFLARESDLSPATRAERRGGMISDGRIAEDREEEDDNISGNADVKAAKEAPKAGLLFRDDAIESLDHAIVWFRSETHTCFEWRYG